MSGAADRFLRLIRRLDAAPERVFDAWLDPDMARTWRVASPADERYRIEAEPRVGGTWTITARCGGTDYTVVGRYLEIDRPRRLVFTFAMPHCSPNYDRLTIEIVPDGSGRILTLTQEGVDIAAELRQLPPDVIGGTEQGWRDMFDVLAAILGPDD